MALIPENPIVPTATVTITQAGNTASPVDVAFTIDDDELLWQAKEACRQDTHAYVTAYLADPTVGLAGGALDKLINALVVELASSTVTK